MKNLLQDTTAVALYMCEAYASREFIAVDATCGRGYDTLWLAPRCKKVFSFDIQDEALGSAKELLIANNIDVSEKSDDAKVFLINDSHENIKKYVTEQPCIVTFNLGFLPGGDKSVTTLTASTMKALMESLEILRVGGVMSITMYPGHEAGASEQDAILDWAKGLNARKFHCVFASMLNQNSNAPQILWITKKK